MMDLQLLLWGRIAPTELNKWMCYRCDAKELLSLFQKYGIDRLLKIWPKFEYQVFIWYIDISNTDKEAWVSSSLCKRQILKNIHVVEIALSHQMSEEMMNLC